MKIWRGGGGERTGERAHRCRYSPAGVHEMSEDGDDRCLAVRARDSDQRHVITGLTKERCSKVAGCFGGVLTFDLHDRAVDREPFATIWNLDENGGCTGFGRRIDIVVPVDDRATDRAEKSTGFNLAAVLGDGRNTHIPRRFDQLRSIRDETWRTRFNLGNEVGERRNLPTGHCPQNRPEGYGSAEEQSLRSRRTAVPRFVHPMPHRRALRS